MDPSAVFYIAIPGGILSGIASALVAAGAVRGEVSNLTREVSRLRDAIDGRGGLSERVTRLEATSCLPR